MTIYDEFVADANIGRDLTELEVADLADEWANTASAVGELDLPAEWKQLPWVNSKSMPRPPEHFVQVQMLCGGCQHRMGLIVTMENPPDAMIITCRCGFINTWHPR